MTPDLHNQLQKNSCRENIKLSITTEDNQMKKRILCFIWMAKKYLKKLAIGL